MDFGALPPEINSGRMYTGPGPAPMLAAAAAWDGLAAELDSTASSYQSEIADLTSASWQGPASASMAGAAVPYVAWMSATAAQAEQTALQAKAAAAAYEIAFAATVPPPVIAANRTLLMALLATNIFGQNNPAIAATEAHYAEMWAQDAAAMYGYAGASRAASTLTPFAPPPQTSSGGGLAGQAASVAQATGTAGGVHAQALPPLMSGVPQSLQSLATPVSSAAPAAAAASPSLITAIDGFLTGPLGPGGLFTIGGVPYLLGVQAYLLPQAAANLTGAAEKVSKLPAAVSGGLAQDGLGSGPRVVGSTGLSGISAGVGRAGMIGGLSVPPGWASAAPAIKTAAAMLPQSSLSAAPAAVVAEGQGNLVSNMALSGLAGRAMVGTGGGAARSADMSGTVVVGEAATTANIFVIPETVISEADA